MAASKQDQVKPGNGKPGADSTPVSKVAPAQELDRLIHERVRLGILSALAVNEALGFNELKQVLQLTDGNLSVHARKLEEAGYISCHKRFEGRVPRTDYRLSETGRAALEGYLAHMEAIIRHVKRGEGADGS